MHERVMYMRDVIVYGAGVQYFSFWFCARTLREKA